MVAQLKHHESALGGVAEILAMDSVPTTQSSIALGGNNIFESYPSIETASASTSGSLMNWVAPASTMCTALDECYIRIRGAFSVTGPRPGVSWLPTSAGVVGKGGRTVVVAGSTGDGAATTNTLSVVPNFPLTLFQDIGIQFNGTTVKTSQGILDPICGVASVIKNEPRCTRDNGDFTSAYVEDSFASAIEGVGADSSVSYANTGATTRNRYFLTTGAGGTTQALADADANSRPFSVILRLSDIGVRTGAWLPPGVQIRISAKRSPAALSLMGKYCNGGPLPNITGITFLPQAFDFMVSRKNLNDSTLAALQRSWVERPLKLPYEQTRSFLTVIPAGQNQVSITGALGGPMPKCVYAFCVNANALNGVTSVGAPDGDGNIFSTINNIMALRPPSDLHFWTNVSLNLGTARGYPTNPLTTYGSTNVNYANTTLTLAELYQMYRQTTTGGPAFLDSSETTNIQPLCFQIQTPTDGWDQTDDVQVQFQGTLTAGPGAPNIGAWALILVGFYDSLLEVASSGQIMVHN